MRPSKYPEASSGARLIPAAVVLFFVVGGCGQYGVQIWQRNGLDAAGFTLLLSATAALVGLYLLLIAIRAIRMGREATHQPSRRGEG